MGSRNLARALQVRQHIAREAARILAESGSRNFLQAKRKAAQQLGVSDARNLPGNEEVEQALVDYQRLFRAHVQPKHLRRLRETAVQGMRFLEHFGPRLVGPVLEGTADEHSEVTLHLFADQVEQVGAFLLEQGIPSELGDRRLRTYSPLGIRRRRSPSSLGIPRSRRNAPTCSTWSANRCSVTSLCWSAVPSSTGPTSRGVNRSRKRMPSAAVSRSRLRCFGCTWDRNRR